MYRVRLFAIRQSRSMERLYNALEATLVALDPLFSKLGYSRVERPVAAVERLAKGLLFDCKCVGNACYPPPECPVR